MQITNKRQINKRIEDNRDNLRKQFEDHLVYECEYSRNTAENCDDWREDWLDTELLITFWSQYKNKTNLPFIWLFA